MVALTGYHHFPGALPYAGVPYGSPVVAPGYVAAPAAVPYVSRPAAYAISPAGYVSPYYAPGPAVAYTGVPAYDDGKYYPGKYERPTFYNVPRVVV